jgi:hypothetical protein
MQPGAGSAHTHSTLQQEFAADDGQHQGNRIAHSDLNDSTRRVGVPLSDSELRTLIVAAGCRGPNPGESHG